MTKRYVFDGISIFYLPPCQSSHFTHRSAYCFHKFKITQSDSLNAYGLVTRGEESLCDVTARLLLGRCLRDIAVLPWLTHRAPECPPSLAESLDYLIFFSFGMVPTRRMPRTNTTTTNRSSPKRVTIPRERRDSIYIVRKGKSFTIN